MASDHLCKYLMTDSIHYSILFKQLSLIGDHSHEGKNRAWIASKLLDAVVQKGQKHITKDCTKSKQSFLSVSERRDNL